MGIISGIPDRQVIEAPGESVEEDMGAGNISSVIEFRLSLTSSFLLAVTTTIRFFTFNAGIPPLFFTPISICRYSFVNRNASAKTHGRFEHAGIVLGTSRDLTIEGRSEEHTSELQS